MKTKGIFIHLKASPDTIVTLAPLYERLKQLGYTEFKRDGIVIEDWPVQFLPVTTPYYREAWINGKVE